MASQLGPIPEQQASTDPPPDVVVDAAPDAAASDKTKPRKTFTAAKAMLRMGMGAGDNDDVASTGSGSVIGKKKKNRRGSDSGVDVGIEWTRNGQTIAAGEKIELGDFALAGDVGDLAEKMEEFEEKIEDVENKLELDKKADVIVAQSETWAEKLTRLRTKVDELGGKMDRHMSEAYLKRLMEVKIEDHRKFYDFLESVVPRLVAISRLDLAARGQPPRPVEQVVAEATRKQRGVPGRSKSMMDSRRSLQWLVFIKVWVRFLH